MIHFPFTSEPSCSLGFIDLINIILMYVFAGLGVIVTVTFLVLFICAIIATVKYLDGRIYENKEKSRN